MASGSLSIKREPQFLESLDDLLIFEAC